MRTAILSICVVSLLTVSYAQADTISYSNTYGPTSVSFSGLLVPLTKFDPALGTLTKVTLQLNANTNAGSIAWDNEGGVASSVTLQIGATVKASAPLNLIAVTAVPVQSGSGSVSADNDASPDYIGDDAFGVTGGTGSDSNSAFTTSSLSTFIATFAGETFNATLESSIKTTLSTDGGYGPINPSPGLTDGTVKVTYEYTPIPEPVTMSLLGLGGLGMLLKRRR
ncbi:MAG: choice-of-anchor E domain-containing protein [Planctomycetaceae bacterium]|nr:choice-of-anchor E domain-containing protein [Planctomycetaceae bacterium]